MEIVKGNDYIATYYKTEDEKYIIVKNGSKWEVWVHYNTPDFRNKLTDGYGEEGIYNTLKDAKHDVLYEWNRRFNK